FVEGKFEGLNFFSIRKQKVGDIIVDALIEALQSKQVNRRPFPTENPSARYGEISIETRAYLSNILDFLHSNANLLKEKVVEESATKFNSFPNPNTKVFKEIILEDVLLTGSTGHIGIKVAEDLSKFKEKYFVSSNRSRNPVSPSKAIPIDLHLSNDDSRKKFIAKGGIIHLASARSNSDDNFVSNEVNLNFNITRIWAGGHFTYLSSGVIYPAIDSAQISESTLPSPGSLYAVGKLMGEYLVKERYEELMVRNIKASYTVIRFFIVFGLNSRFHADQVLYGLCKHIFEGGLFFCDDRCGFEGYGFSWISLSDLSRAITESQIYKVNGIFNLASGFITWKELINKISIRMSTVIDVHFEEKLEGIDYFSIPNSRGMLDISNAQRELAWTPTSNIDALLDEYIPNFINHYTS
ncbi:MAG: NAD(P)-dependent oxidoreductase, partial [Chryseobacterium sp.]